MFKCDKKRINLYEVFAIITYSSYKLFHYIDNTIFMIVYNCNYIYLLKKKSLISFMSNVVIIIYIQIYGLLYLYW